MSKEEQEALEAQRARRRRVNRMKSMIVLTIAIWMLVSLLSIIILSVCLWKLNRRVHNLESARDEAVLAAATETAGEEDGTEPDTSEAAEESTEIVNVDYTKVIRGIDTGDNMAEEGDTHYVYLTFDCTPGSNTSAILDVLDTYGLKATFFLSGSVSEEYYDVVGRIADEGHTVGMHSYSNTYSTIYASTDAFAEDLEQIDDFLYGLTGAHSAYYRFPGGSGNEISNVDMAEFVHILNQNDISFFDWNVSAGDAAADYTVQDVLDNVLEGVTQYKTSVVLLHDASDKSTTVEALAPLIESLQQENAQILPIDENTALIQYIKADSVQ